MGKILVIGYYYKNNLGDDLFLETIPNLFCRSDLKFISVDDITKESLDSYDGIIFGGGDLVNDYFLNKVKYVRDNYSGPVYAFSVGIPYYETIAKGYLKYYDHVFTRNKKFLLPLQHALGSQYAHYLPDVVMSYDKTSSKSWNIRNKHKIGVFLPSSIGKLPILMKLISFFERILKSNPDNVLHFGCFDTNDGPNHDRIINTAITDALPKGRVINDLKRYNGEEMLELMSGFGMIIASRFHSHILSILAGVPFVSLHYSNKVTLLIEEKSLSDVHCTIQMDGNAKPVDFNLTALWSKYTHVRSNLTDIHNRLIAIKEHDRSLFKDNYQLENLILHGDRRQIQPCKFFSDRVDHITDKFSRKLTEVSLPKEKLTVEKSTVIAKDLIYEITGEISNSGVSGTIDNLIQNPEKLRDMVVWVWKNKREKALISVPRFNLHTTCIQGYRGIHRAGWKFALESLECLHSNHGVILDPYCDATFGWCRENPCKSYGIIPYTSPWCGFFHHTPSAEYSDNNIDISTSTLEFKQSLETCMGLFVLSEWLAVWLRERLRSLGYPDVPVVSLFHPTIVHQVIPFSLPDHEKISVINVGAWLRNTYSIYALDLDESRFVKYRLKGKMMDNYFPPETLDLSKDYDRTNPFLVCLHKYISEKDLYDSDNLEDLIKTQISTVETLEYIPDDEYDLMMSKYVVFVDFIECSAANTVIECMARGTPPIVVNRLLPVVEYLGESYPLYFDSIDEVGSLLTIDNISNAVNYLKDPKIKSMVSAEKFYSDLIRSDISSQITGKLRDLL